MNSRHITHCRSDNVPGVHNTAILYPKYFYVLLQRSGYLSVFLYYISPSSTILPVFPEPQRSPGAAFRASGESTGRKLSNFLYFFAQYRQDFFIVSHNSVICPLKYFCLGIRIYRNHCISSRYTCKMLNSSRNSNGKIYPRADRFA